MNRRHWLQATSFGALGPALATLATALPTAARAAGTPLKIGFIYSGPVSNVGWTFQHDLGRKLVPSRLKPNASSASWWPMAAR
jgi:basic membrane protein A